MLRRLTVSGVHGLAALELELGPLIALIGPRGSGKSQLLASIAWLLRAGPMPGGDHVSVSAEVDDGGAFVRAIRRDVGDRAESTTDLAGLPPASFLRARDRLSTIHTPEEGSVGHAMAARLRRPVTGDADVAEALVGAIQECCADGLSGELLLIEEPELMLAPQAQRYLSSLLHRLAESGNQVIYSTWSAAFVDAVHADEIIRLDLRARGSVVRRTDRKPLTDEQRLRLAAEFDHERSEMFFARCVVLTEGRTERFTLPLVFRALGHDLDAEGIAVVEVGGKGNLPLIAGVLHDLRIPCVVVFDTDRGHDPRLDAAIARAAGRDRVVALDPDFEAVAGIRRSDEKVLAAWRRFSDAGPADVPPALRRVVEVAEGLLA